MLECAGAICGNLAAGRDCFAAAVLAITPSCNDCRHQSSKSARRAELLSATSRAHDIVGGCAQQRRQKGEKIMGGPGIVERSDQRLNKACGAVAGANVGPTLEHMGSAASARCSGGGLVAVKSEMDREGH